MTLRQRLCRTSGLASTSAWASRCSGTTSASWMTSTIHCNLVLPAIHQQDSLPRAAFAIVGSTKLQWMVDVIHDADVVPEHLLAHALVEARPLVLHSRCRKVIKEKAHKVEHRGWFQNYCVLARRKLPGINGPVRLVARAFRQSLGIDVRNVRSVFLRPARGRAFLHGDGKHRVRVAIRRKQAA